MLGVQLLILGVVLLIIPTIIGTLFADHTRKSPALAWVSGQMVLWAGFFVICVPMILLQKSFQTTCNLFHFYTGILVGAVLLRKLILYSKYKNEKRASVEKKEPKSKSQYLLWGIFFALLLVQFVLTVFLAYEEGDDAFYVAISTITQDADSMYIKLPYTGGSTGLDARHGLAPFPIWIAYLARISGMAPVMVAQIAVPLFIIGMAYAIYYMIAECLFEEKKESIPFFMILIGLLIMFGGYSVYSPENFLLVRASQGKAVIANIVIPFLMMLIINILQCLEKEEKIQKMVWMLMGLTCMTGCLCSTLGTILICMFLGAAGLCTAVCYRRWNILFPMGFCCVIPVGMALLYMVIQ